MANRRQDEQDEQKRMDSTTMSIKHTQDTLPLPSSVELAEFATQATSVCRRLGIHQFNDDSTSDIVVERIYGGITNELVRIIMPAGRRQEGRKHIQDSSAESVIVRVFGPAVAKERVPR